MAVQYIELLTEDNESILLYKVYNDYIKLYLSFISIVLAHEKIRQNICKNVRVLTFVKYCINVARTFWMVNGNVQLREQNSQNFCTMQVIQHQ